MNEGFFVVEDSFTNSGSLIVMFTTLRCKKVSYSVRTQNITKSVDNM
jgi:hypothetical protein